MKELWYTPAQMRMILAAKEAAEESNRFYDELETDEHKKAILTDAA